MENVNSDQNKFHEVIIVVANDIQMFSTEQGAVVANFGKTLPINPKTAALATKDYIFAAYQNKPALKALLLGKQKQSTKIGDMIIPERASALAITTCGNYCLVGIGNDLYIWKVSSGNLLAIIEHHHNTITCIKLSSDDFYVLTGSEDGQVNVWLLPELVSRTRTTVAKPRFTWQHHMKTLTDIYITPLRNNARVVTVSEDMTCRLYDLNSGYLLCTFLIGRPLSAVTMDTLQNFIFVGDDSGGLLRINIFDPLPISKEKNIDTGDIIKAHERNIVLISINTNGTKLVTASEDGFVKFWALDSLACTLGIKVDGTISNALLMISPTNLMAKDADPNLQPVTFSRAIDQNSAVEIYCTRPEEQELSKLSDYEFGLDYDTTATFTDSGSQNTFDQVMNAQHIDEVIDFNKQLYHLSCNFTFDSLPPQDSE